MTDKEKQQKVNPAHVFYLTGAKKHYEEIAASEEGKAHWDLTVEDDEAIRQFLSSEKLMIKAGEFAKALLASEDRLGEEASFYALKAFFLKMSCTDKATVERFVKGVAAFARTEKFKKMSALFDDTESFFEQRLYRDVDPIVEAVVAFTKGADLIEFDNLVDYFDIIYPVAKEVIEERRTATGEPVLLSEFFSNYDYDKMEFRKSLYDLALERCEPWSPPVEKITVSALEKFLYPVDQLSESMLTNPMAATGAKIGVSTTAKEQEAELRRIARKRGEKYEPPAYVMYSLDIAEIEGVAYSRKLDFYDFLVMCTVGSLYESGQKEMSLRHIHRAMGGKSKATNDQVAKIYQSLTKLGSTRIWIDTQAEVDAGYNYKQTKKDKIALDFERDTKFVNGNYSEAVIVLKERPFLFDFALERNCYTTFEPDIMRSSLSLTESNIGIRDYLLRRISGYKRDKGDKGGSKKQTKQRVELVQQQKFLYSTILNHAGITDPRQRNRKKKDIQRLLEEFKHKGFIENWREDKTKGKEGVIVSYIAVIYTDPKKPKKGD